MRLKSLGSGSAGNSTYIGTDNTHLLVDAGLSLKRISEGLNEAELTLADMDAVLITHEHIDHIGALGVLLRKNPLPVYATEGTVREILSCKGLGSFPVDVFKVIEADKEFSVGDISVTPFEISHDAAEPVAFTLKAGKKAAGIVTDLGCYNGYVTEHLKGLDMVLIEANHDIRMLESGPYPYPLKKRILGSGGHLSNESSGRLLSEILNDNMKHVLLGHISRKNNFKELALAAVKNEISVSGRGYKAEDFHIRAASFDRTTEIMEV